MSARRWWNFTVTAMLLLAVPLVILGWRARPHGAAPALALRLVANDQDGKAEGTNKPSDTKPAPANTKDEKPAASAGAGGPPPAVVRVGVVGKESAQSRWDVVGRLQEVRRSAVATEGQGRVIEVNAEEGDRVEAGKTVLARIDDVWMAMAVESSESTLVQRRADVAEAEAKLKQSQRDLKYLVELEASGAAKAREVDLARASVEQDSARVDSAQAAVLVAAVVRKRMKVELDRLCVLAPFDGTVVRKHTEVGQWVTQGTVVAEIISRGAIDAVVDVPERLVSRLAVGDQVEVLVEALQLEKMGAIIAINPLGANAARTFPVKVRLADPEGKLKAGMSATAHMPAGDMVEVLTVPRDAVVRQPSGAVVWVNVNGQALPAGIRVLFGLADRYAVQTTGTGPPLQPQMQVVIEGAERLFPTRPLIIAEQAAEKPAAAPAARSGA